MNIRTKQIQEQQFTFKFESLKCKVQESTSVMHHCRQSANVTISVIHSIVTSGVP